MYCRDCGAELTDGVHICPMRDNKTSNAQINEITPKKNLSVISIIGFCVSFLAPVLFLVFAYYGLDFVAWIDGDSLSGTGILGLFLMLIQYAVLMYFVVEASGFVGFAALILSITGLILSPKKQRRGKGFAIAGIVISGIFLLFLFACIVTVLVLSK